MRPGRGRLRLRPFILCFNRTAISIQKIDSKSSKSHLKSLPRISPKSYRHKLYLRPSFIAFFNFSHKRPTFAFTVESGYTLAFANRIAHNGTHAETRAFRTGALSLPSTRAARSRTSPGRVSERQTLPLLSLGRRCSRRTQRACGTAMRLCASLSRRRRGPAGLRDLFASAEVAACTPCAQCFPNVRDEGWYHYPRCALCAVETLGARLSK